jgi:DNA-binding IclR family transcriptional regulator
MKSAETKSTDTPRIGIKVLVKTMGILNFMAQEDKPGFTLGEISASQKLNKSTCHNILFTLISGGYVEKTSDGYRLGIGIFQVGTSLINRLDVRQTVYPFMEELRAAHGETVFLYLPQEKHAVCIERLTGRYSSSHLMRVGSSLPLHLGAAPKILLAGRSDSEVRAYLNSVAADPGTNVNEEYLWSQISSIRKDGIAYSIGDVEVNTAAVSAPIRDRSSQVVAALSVSWLDKQLLIPTTDLAADVKSASKRASLALGSRE